jgi:hypothetical protein
LDNCCFNRPYNDQAFLKNYLEAEAKIYMQKEILELFGNCVPKVYTYQRYVWFLTTVIKKAFLPDFSQTDFSLRADIAAGSLSA